MTDFPTLLYTLSCEILSLLYLNLFPFTDPTYTGSIFVCGPLHHYVLPFYIPKA